MDVHYSDKLKHAFVIRDSELKKLTRLLQDRIGKVDILAHCADGFYREFETVKDLITYENPKSKEICRIRLRARANDGSKSATIDFSDASWEGISIDCTGGEDDVSKFKEKTLDIIAGMRPWYNMLTSINFVSVSIIVFFILYLAARLTNLWLQASDFKAEVSGSIIVLLIFLFIFLFMSLLFGNRLRDPLFPRAVFTIGQGKSRFKHKEQIQWVVIIGFAVSLAAGLVIAIWQASAG